MWLITVLSGGIFNTSHAAAKATAKATNKAPLILVLGDSLSAAFGIEQSKGWAALLEKKLLDNHYPFQVVNASISGETSQGGVQRLPDLLEKHQPAIVILELGANDGLRGLDLAMLRNNLQLIITKTIATNAKLLLVGMRLPPNYGQAYTERFHQLYVDLAQHNNIPWVPFLLDNVATRTNLMQADGLHPKANAQSIVLDNIWEKLKPLLINN